MARRSARTRCTRSRRGAAARRVRMLSLDGARARPGAPASSSKYSRAAATAARDERRRHRRAPTRERARAVALAARGRAQTQLGATTSGLTRLARRADDIAATVSIPRPARRARVARADRERRLGVARRVDRALAVLAVVPRGEEHEHLGIFPKERVDLQRPRRVRRARRAPRVGVQLGAHLERARQHVLREVRRHAAQPAAQAVLRRAEVVDEHARAGRHADVRGELASAVEGRRSRRTGTSSGTSLQNRRRRQTSTCNCRRRDYSRSSRPKPSRRTPILRRVVAVRVARARDCEVVVRGGRARDAPGDVRAVAVLAVAAVVARVPGVRDDLAHLVVHARARRSVALRARRLAVHAVGEVAREIVEPGVADADDLARARDSARPQRRGLAAVRARRARLHDARRLAIEHARARRVADARDVRAARERARAPRASSAPPLSSGSSISAWPRARAPPTTRPRRARARLGVQLPPRPRRRARRPPLGAGREADEQRRAPRPRRAARRAPRRAAALISGASLPSAGSGSRLRAHASAPQPPPAATAAAGGARHEHASPPSAWLAPRTVRTAAAPSAARARAPAAATRQRAAQRAAAAASAAAAVASATRCRRGAPRRIVGELVARGGPHCAAKSASGIGARPAARQRAAREAERRGEAEEALMASFGTSGIRSRPRRFKAIKAKP